MKNQKRNGKRRGGSTSSISRGPKTPPAFKPTISIRKKFRFLATATITDLSITAMDLAKFLSVGISTTAVVSLIDAIHLVKLQAWSPPVSGATVACEFKQENTTFIGSPSQTYSDTCLSTAFPAHLKARPPPNSLSGFWIAGQATSTASVITLTLAAGSIVDFTFDIRMIDDANTPGNDFTTTATPVVGVIYLRNLCTGLLTPISFPGIV